MFLCRAQADGANRVFMGAFGVDQHMQAVSEQPHGDKPDLSVIEVIILALKCRVPIEPLRSCNDTPCLAMFVASLAGSNSILITFPYTH